MEANIRVREAMTQDVITIAPRESVNKAAKRMLENNIGCIVVVENSKPVGIVTERDICFSVAASDRLPSEVLVKDIMSFPVVTISPEKTIDEAARTMVKNNFRRLAVIENDSLVGVITNKDIITISPQVSEIMRELSAITKAQQYTFREPLEKGTCEICGEYMVDITEVNGKFVCEHCNEDFPGGE